MSIYATRSGEYNSNHKDLRVEAITTIIGLSADRDLLEPFVVGHNISFDDNGNSERAVVSQFLKDSDEVRIVPVNANGTAITIPYADVEIWY